MPSSVPPLTIPASKNEVWLMAFMHDALGDGRSFRSFNVLDDLIARAWRSRRTYRYLRSRDRRGKLRGIRCDNGPEYVSGALLQWAAERQIRLEYIQPGKPQQNAHVERYNRTVRYDWLAQHILDSIAEVQETATRWLWTYNNERPNMALGGFPPLIQKFAMAA